jgi:O-antigen ligase
VTQKRTKKTDISVSVAPEADLPLIPARMLTVLWFISLALPNIVFSGSFWFQTLHLMKWVVAMVPVGIACVVAGYRLLRHGGDRIRVRIDLFGILWFFMLLYMTVQPLWLDLRSPSTFFREWFFFASMWIMYVLSYNSFPGSRFAAVAFGASLNGAVSTFFAELQIRNLSDPFSFILPTPGNYIANTGQQEMFGLWLAIALLCSLYLYITVIPEMQRKTGTSRPVACYVVLVLILVNAWGLWGTTTRSALGGFFAALVFMWILYTKSGDVSRRRRFYAGILLVLFAFSCSVAFNSSRSGSLRSKVEDILENPTQIGGRDGIWRTSWTMFTMHPVRGVGLGQYKWHYLDAQREAFSRYPEQKFQYTHWAHNEILQWFCEAGFPGGGVLLCLGIWWLFAFFRRAFGRPSANRPGSLGDEAIWACACLALIWFNAAFSRPFHRIENSLWTALAFAIANRELLPGVWCVSGRREDDESGVRRSSAAVRLAGAAIAAAAVFGFSFLGHGLYGDYLIRRAIQTNDAVEQRALLDAAHRSLMVRDVAEKQLAYHHISLGQAMKSNEALAEGLNRLLRFFEREPQAEDLKILIDWSSKLRQKPILDKLLTYLKPGTVAVRNSGS